jgi:hypothetical protein
LEAALSRLLSVLLGTTLAKASIVFFSLLNTRARNEVFETLITATHGDRYNTYWNGQPGSPRVPRVSGLLALIRQLDDERNRLVHWQTVQSVSRNPDGSTHAFEQLMKPDFWFREPRATPMAIQIADLEAFIRKADFVTRSIVMFRGFTGDDRFPDEAKRTWSQIFQEPVPYPPPDAHPLSPNYKAPNVSHTR